MREVSSVQFSPDAVEITYTDRAQVKSVAGQPVMLVSTVILGRDSPAFTDEVHALTIAVEDLLGEVLDEHQTAQVYEADDPDEESEDLGMGSG